MNVNTGDRVWPEHRNTHSEAPSEWDWEESAEFISEGGAKTMRHRWGWKRDTGDIRAIRKGGHSGRHAGGQRASGDTQSEGLDLCVKVKRTTCTPSSGRSWSSSSLCGSDLRLNVYFSKPRHKSNANNINHQLSWTEQVKWNYMIGPHIQFITL